MSIITPNHLPHEQPFLFFKEKRNDFTLTGTDSKPNAEPEQDEEEEKALLCFKCLTAITSEKEAIAVNSGHTHTFFNPAGLVYEIRCFKKADGCLVCGEPSSEFSWFKGYTWQYDLCMGCHQHLGWHFSSSFDSFHGLIIQHLRPSP